MNPLEIICPKCKAPVGERCKNYKGQGKQSCPERTGRVRKQHERSAEQARQSEQTAPPQEPDLFADLPDDSPRIPGLCRPPTASEQEDFARDFPSYVRKLEE